MNQPPLEVADIIRSAAESFRERSRRWITWQHRKVLDAILRCRTAMLGGHRDRCADCGHLAISYNSCGNRHCPRCQGNARRRWLRAREAELLPTRYLHAVFTLPRELAPVALQNKKVIFNLLFHSSAETLLEIARDPRHLGAEIGFFSVLHTWNQRLQFHPHAHRILAAGGLSPDHTKWIGSSRRFFPPIKVLSRVFRGKFLAGLKTTFQSGDLHFHGALQHLAEPRTFRAWLRTLFRQDRVVYAKRPFGGPEHALRYLGAYTHRVAISNHRLLALQNGNVTFRWRDSAHGNKKRLMSYRSMSSCAASSCRYYLAASCASATSASLPTADVPVCCPSASNCCAASPKTTLRLRRQLRVSPVHAGGVRSVVEPCTWSNGSPPPNFGSVLLRRLSGVLHDRIYQNPLPRHPSGSTADLCLVPEPSRPVQGWKLPMDTSWRPDASSLIRPQRKRKRRLRQLLTESAAVLHSKYIGA
jgi:Putative transposase/Transposase zinc-binding domain